MKRHVAVFALLASLSSGTFACGDEAAKQLAPTAEGSSLAASKPKSANAKKFAVDGNSSKVEFAMEAPQEKIRGRIVGTAVTGEVLVDPTDVTQTTGSIAVDISNLELFQRKADDSNAFSEETKSDLQNKHARQWLEIDESTPQDMRQKNARVEFAIRSITSASDKDVSKLTGPSRKTTVHAKGDLLLHGRQLPKEVDLEVTFKYDGDKPLSMEIKTVKPLPVGLAEYDVRPREAFGKLAEKGLSALSPKVAKEAPIELDIVAVMGDAPPSGSAAASAAPSASAPPDASASAATSASAAPSASAAAAPSASAAPAKSAAPTAAPAASSPKPKK